MVFINWFLKRFIFLKRIIIELFDAFFYQKSSRSILHQYNAHRNPYSAMLFYNLFGRILLGTKEFIALITNNVIFKKSITIDGFDKPVDFEKLYKNGTSKFLWPKSPMIQTFEPNIDEKYYEKMLDSLMLAYKHQNDNIDKTKEWDRISTEFKNLFFDKNGKIIPKNIENFRSDPKIYIKIFNEQYSYIDTNSSYYKTYLNAIDLVLEYHRYSSKVDKELLASISESNAGNYLSITYRGKKISEQLLYHTVIVNDLINHVKLSQDKRSVILDIGVSYGGMTRLLSYYFTNSTQILIDLPETLVLTAYYLKYNFPDKKIALLCDIYDRLDQFDEIVNEYDFIIIPPYVLDYVSKQSIDLVINAASLSFMSKEYLEVYIKHINKVLKKGSYFYSLNTTEDSQWGIGSHNWNFETEYQTILFNYDNRFSYPQWLGKKMT